MKVAVTGHRRLDNSFYNSWTPSEAWIFARNQLTMLLVQLKAKYKIDLKIIGGGAIGIDQIWQFAAQNNDIYNILAMPFKGQSGWDNRDGELVQTSERPWPASVARAFESMKEKADKVVVVSPGTFTAQKMQVRNEYMVDWCQVLVAVWDRSKTERCGTYNCIKYALSQGKKVFHIDPVAHTAQMLDPASVIKVPPVILEFSDEWRWLSNFWRAPMQVKGRTFPTLEHAFQAGKTRSHNEQEQIRKAGTPGDAKRMGGPRGIIKNIRRDWDTRRLSWMRKLLHIKFSDPTLRNNLIMTGSAKLVEGNTWHDNFWGNCSCDRCKKKRGENTLGILLMEVRKSLQ